MLPGIMVSETRRLYGYPLNASDFTMQANIMIKSYHNLVMVKRNLGIYIDVNFAILPWRVRNIWLTRLSRFFVKFPCIEQIHKKNVIHCWIRHSANHANLVIICANMWTYTSAKPMSVIIIIFPQTFSTHIVYVYDSAWVKNTCISSIFSTLRSSSAENIQQVLVFAIIFQISFLKCYSFSCVKHCACNKSASKQRP